MIDCFGKDRWKCTSMVASVLLLCASFLRDALLTLVLVVCVSVAAREGGGGLARKLLLVFRELPGVNWIIGWVLRREVRGFLKQLDPNSFKAGPRTGLAIPEKGLSQDKLLEELKRRKKVEIDPHTGKIFAYVYTSKDSRFETVQKAFDIFQWDSHSESSTEDETESQHSKDAIVKMFFHAFMHENALNPLVFPSLRQFEVETVAMVANMLHGDGHCVGTVTSGGTESLLMAVKTYRDRARSLFPKIKHPEIVAPLTVHPAFEKAAGYFDIKIVHVPLNTNYTVNIDEYRKAISPNTILLVVSATEYCYGMVDPVEEISQIAQEKGLPVHVDSCIGGFMLPWVEKVGYKVPVFDFRLPAVTSISADVHKYGLGAKGASVIVYRNADIRKYQIFAYSEWPGGLFGSPSMAGTRPGGNIASSWAVLQCMGQDGYMDMAKKLMEVATRMKEGIQSIEGLFVCGTPHMTIFSFGSSDKDLSVFALADLMEKNGWKIERQMDTLHCTVLPSHTLESADLFVEELRSACQTVKSDPSLAKKGSAGVYGMVGVIPDKAIVKDFLVEFFNEVYS